MIVLKVDLKQGLIKMVLKKASNINRKQDQERETI